jgi:hypothetical protein
MEISVRPPVVRAIALFNVPQQMPTTSFRVSAVSVSQGPSPPWQWHPTLRLSVFCCCCAHWRGALVVLPGATRCSPSRAWSPNCHTLCSMPWRCRCPWTFTCQVGGRGSLTSDCPMCSLSASWARSVVLSRHITLYYPCHVLVLLPWAMPATRARGVGGAVGVGSAMWCDGRDGAMPLGPLTSCRMRLPMSLSWWKWLLRCSVTVAVTVVAVCCRCPCSCLRHD